MDKIELNELHKKLFLCEICDEHLKSKLKDILFWIQKLISEEVTLFKVINSSQAQQIKLKELEEISQKIIFFNGIYVKLLNLRKSLSSNSKNISESKLNKIKIIFESNEKETNDYLNDILIRNNLLKKLPCLLNEIEAEENKIYDILESYSLENN